MTLIFLYKTIRHYFKCWHLPMCSECSQEEAVPIAWRPCRARLPFYSFQSSAHIFAEIWKFQFLGTRLKQVLWKITQKKTTQVIVSQLMSWFVKGLIHNENKAQGEWSSWDNQYYFLLLTDLPSQDIIRNLLTESRSTESCVFYQCNGVDSTVAISKAISKWSVPRSSHC